MSKEASLALGSAERYTHYLKCYALRLGSNEAIVDRGQERMREICEKLTKSGEILVKEGTRRAPKELEKRNARHFSRSHRFSQSMFSLWFSAFTGHEKE